MQKKHLLLFIIAFSCAMSLYAKSVKINSKTEIKPYLIKIEVIEKEGDRALILGKVKQLPRFSYSISFEDCRIISSASPDGIPGKLILWNGDRKITKLIKTISDSGDNFVLEFPIESIPTMGTFDLKIGNILNSRNTDIIIENLTIQKKKN